MIYQFNQLTLDTEQFRLSLSNVSISIEPLVFDLLVHLIKNRDRVVTREELLDSLWKGKIVTDAALAVRVKDARKAVQDNGSSQSVIKTIHGRGYQFVAVVRQLSSDDIFKNLEETSSDDASPLPKMPSIAVLPFYNMSDDPEQHYFSDGIAEDIITALSKIKNLRVITGKPSSTNAEQSVGLRKAGDEQGVQYWLEGSVRKSGNRVRVSIQLIEASTGLHIWVERYDRELEDIFAVQDEIMREIVMALDVQLREGEQARFWSSGTNNLKAWECVRLGASDALGANPETKLQAKALFEKALELDPDYSNAWVMLGWIYQFYSDVASGATDKAKMKLALNSMLECAEKALIADSACADACGLMAIYYLEVKAYDLATEMAEKAVLLAPNNAENLSIAALIMNKTGNPEKGLKLKEKSMLVCPMYRPGNLRGLGLSYYLLGRFELAINSFNESLIWEPDYLTAHANLASIYGELNRMDEAKRSASEILRLAPDFSIRAYTADLSFQDPEVLSRISEGLTRAGLPE